MQRERFPDCFQMPAAIFSQLCRIDAPVLRYQVFVYNVERSSEAVVVEVVEEDVVLRAVLKLFPGQGCSPGLQGSWSWVLLLLIAFTS